MKKDRRLLYIITTLFVLSLVVIGTTSVIAQKQPNSDDVLKQAALKKSDFPKNVEDFTFSSEKILSLQHLSGLRDLWMRIA